MQFQVRLPGASSNMLLKIDGDKTIADLTEELGKILFQGTGHRRCVIYSYTSSNQERKRITDPLSRTKLKNSELKDGASIYISSKSYREIGVTASAVSSNRLTLNLCLIPLEKSATVPLEIDDSLTLRDLKVRIFTLFNASINQNPLYLRRVDTWIRYGTGRDSLSLKENHFTSNDIISLQISENTDGRSHIPGLCGLLNPENRCFFNSALQCLTQIPAFTRNLRRYQNNDRPGILTEYLKLMQQMWSGQYKRIESNRLFNTIVDHLDQYGDGRQEDAQEFLCRFLDSLQEELPNENNLIKQLFFSQIQSDITCERCQQTKSHSSSINILPISMKDYVRLNTRLIKSNGEQISISLVTESPLVKGQDLINCFLQHYPAMIVKDSLYVVELRSNEIVRFFVNDDRVEGSTQEIAFIEYMRTTRRKICILCKFYDRTTEKPFRPPVYLTCGTRTLSYVDIEDQIEQIYGHLCSSGNISVEDLSIIPILHNGNSPQTSMDLSPQQKFDNIKHFRIVVQSQSVRLYTEFFRNTRYIDDSYLISLINDFFDTEKLGDSYECLSCGKRTPAQQGTHFRFPLPPILMIQLKRFGYDEGVGKKIDRLIRFPLKELELKNFLIEQNDSQQRPYSHATLYDLAAVCNHHGNIRTGHYTTYAEYAPCKDWYSFNDKTVLQIENSESVITENAYILFYVRRDAK